MQYWSVSLLAATIHTVINKDVLFGGKKTRTQAAQTAYRVFALTILAHMASDTLWGGFYACGLTAATSLDTSAYFVLMAISVTTWAHYVACYLDERGPFGAALTKCAETLALLQVATVAVNVFTPVLFWFDGAGAYHAGVARHAFLVAQIAVFVACSVFALFHAASRPDVHVGRWRTIGVSSLTMAGTALLQALFPLLPLYAIGCVLESCMVHTFVLEDEREQARLDLERSLERERETTAALEAARRKANFDALTGTGSRTAFFETEEDLVRSIRKGACPPFAVAVFDLNGLKHANDTLGHAAGDAMLIEAADLIRNTFSESRIFRIGGDEFCAIVEGKDFERRESLARSFDEQAEENLKRGRTVVSIGMSGFRPGQDETFGAAFTRADDLMYERKRELEQMGAFGR